MSAAPTILNYYVSAKDCFVVRTTESEGTTLIPLDVPEGYVERMASKFDAAFSAGRVNPRRPAQTADIVFEDGFDTALQAVGDALIKPALAGIGADVPIVLVPHRQLHRIPLHAVTVEGMPFVARNPVVYAQSAALYAASKAAPGGMRTPGIAGFSVAFREQGKNTRDAFERSVRSFVGADAEVARDLAASMERVLSALATRSIVHLSCHGVQGAVSPLASSLFCSDGETLPTAELSANRAGHRISVRQVLELTSLPEVVVLDACMSGRQFFSVGEEPLGFPAAFLLGGAKAIVASGWSVEQHCAAVFFAAVAAAWIDSVTLAEACRSAYLETRRQFPHVYHWAAFALYGDDSLRRPSWFKLDASSQPSAGG